MRLSVKERTAIKESIHKNFGPDTRVFLFGSRLDERKRGGDIDLYVETELEGERLIFAKLQAMTDIQLKIGDRKIDIITFNPGKSSNWPLIVQKAREKGRVI